MTRKPGTLASRTKDCLKAVSAEKLIKSQDRRSFWDRWILQPPFVFEQDKWEAWEVELIGAMSQKKSVARLPQRIERFFGKHFLFCFLCWLLLYGHLHCLRPSSKNKTLCHVTWQFHESPINLTMREGWFQCKTLSKRAEALSKFSKLWMKDLLTTCSPTKTLYIDK